MPTEDPFTITIRRRVPLAAAFVSGLLLVPASMFALVSPMAMAGGPSASGWLLALFLIAQPVLLAASVLAGCLCYRRFSRWSFAIALAPPAAFLAAMKLLGGM